MSSASSPHAPQSDAITESHNGNQEASGSSRLTMTSISTITHPNASSQQAFITRFTAQPSVQKQYSDAAAAYGAGLEALQQARNLKEKFITRCNSDGSLRLPKSLQLTLVNRAKFTTVENNPNFFKEQIAELERIEKTTSESIYKGILESKTQLILHHEARSNAHSFIALQTAAYKQFVVKSAQTYDGITGTSTSSNSSFIFPIDALVSHFEQFLHKHVQEHALELLEKHRKEEELKTEAAAANTLVQEKILAGAHTGETIKLVVEKTVKEQLSSLNNKQAQPTHGQRSNSHVSPACYAA
jgi:hypothetical protein